MAHAIQPDLTLIVPGVPSFEFPRSRPVPNMHLIGRWTTREGGDPLGRDVPFPYEQLDDSKRLVYASLGTMQTRHEHVLLAVATAAMKLPDVQLVIALGKKDAEISPALRELVEEDKLIVVPFAPQAKLVPQAAAFVTHAGMNSAMMALRHGVPTVCIPITNDQPGVAARMVAAGAAVAVPVANATTERLLNALNTVLEKPQFRDRAKHISAESEAAGGVVHAADIVGHVLKVGRPVSHGEV